MRGQTEIDEATDSGYQEDDIDNITTRRRDLNPVPLGTAVLLCLDEVGRASRMGSTEYQLPTRHGEHRPRHVIERIVDGTVWASSSRALCVGAPLKACHFVCIELGNLQGRKR